MKKNKNNDNLLDQYAKKYLLFLQFEKKLSKNTIEAYWSDLKRYINYLNDIFNIKLPNKIKIKHIREFVNKLANSLICLIFILLGNFILKISFK
jgi:site-specific recombinase XerD